MINGWEVCPRCFAALGKWRCKGNQIFSVSKKYFCQQNQKKALTLRRKIKNLSHDEICGYKK